MTDSRVLTRGEVEASLSRVPFHDEQKLRAHDAAQREEIDRLRDRLREMLELYDRKGHGDFEAKFHRAAIVASIRAEVFGK